MNPKSDQMTPKGLSLRWLGVPSVEIDGSPVHLETQKALALLAYLSLSEHPVPREALSTMLWPEFDHPHAYANLRRNLASLDKSLGRSWIDANRNTIALKKSEGLWIDIEEYFELIQSCRRHCPSSDIPCRECLLRLEEAVRLYRGEFLSCLNFKDCNDFDDWQYFQREEAAQELSTALRRLAEGFAALGDVERVIRYARRWVKLDKFNEEAQRFLIQAYAQAGQRGAAFRQYEECRRVLDEELGQPPEPETTALIEKIYSLRPAARPALGFAVPALLGNGPAFEPLHGSCSALTMQHYRLVHQEPLH